MVKTHIEQHMLNAHDRIARTIDLYTMLEDEIAETVVRVVNGQHTIDRQAVDALGKVTARKLSMLTCDCSKLFR